MNTLSRGACALVCAGLLTGASTSAWANSTRVVVGASHAGYVLDVRYHHNHYYPPSGYVVRTLPEARYAVRWNNATYYFHEGIWYRPERTHFIVVAPPIGAFVPVLPPFHTMIWVRGEPWYYANNAYYVWRPAERAYVVVSPPDDEAMVSTTAPDGDVYAYPKDGQSPEQAASDRYECYRWASGETGFDPAKPGDGVPAGEIGVKRNEYRHAMTACLHGRGYSAS